jgi:hypothetical protein
MFYEYSVESVPYFRFEELDTIPGFVHAFTSRDTDKASGIVSPREGVFQKTRFLKALGILQNQTFQAHQVHSSHILDSQDIILDRPLDGDGILIDTPELFGIIRTADCVPILIVDPGLQRVGMIHAGWKGTADHILRNGIKAFMGQPTTELKQLILAIGPCIRSCCYAVGGNVKQQFLQKGHDINSLFTGRHLDLVKANLLDAYNLGIVQVLDCELCTSCQHHSFYSHRKNRDEGRMWMLAGFRSSERKVPLRANSRP